MTNQDSQLNLFDEELELDLDSSSLEYLGLSDEEETEVSEDSSPKLLTLKLLQSAIAQQNPDDRVMIDFSEYVLPNLLQYAIGVTAKGGNFFEQIDAKRLAQGKKRVRRDNAADQSLNTHLLNGLFPANLIQKRLAKLNTNTKRYVKETERRIGIASLILHDFEKFDYRLFPEIPEDYKRIQADIEQDIRKDCAIAQHREIFNILVPTLGLDQFLFPDSPQQWETYRDDLLYIAYNTQRRNDTNLNLSENNLQPELRDQTIECLSDLTCLGDRFASIIKHPQDATKQSLTDILHTLSDGQLNLTYHSIAENRGVLTNVVNNAVMEAHTEAGYEPLLYLPTGVIYLCERETPSISPETLPQRVVETIKSLCRSQLQAKQTGFGRDGKGMKYAEYYDLFFDEKALMEVALDATLRILRDGKASSAKKRSDNLVSYQQQGILSSDYNFQFEDDIRIDQLAEFGDVITRKIWGETLDHIKTACKQDKTLPKPPDLNLILEIAKFWELETDIPVIREIQRINETLKEHKRKGNTGGVPYDWYYLASRYIQHNPGIAPEDIRDIGETLINFVHKQIKPIVEQYQIPDGWDDVRDWVSRVVMLPQETTVSETDIFRQELDHYNKAKKSGRGRQLICSISHSPYSVSEQMESAVLFTPQVYTNKQMLGGSNAKRNISSIAGTEMMLRQILMNQTQAVGKRFEDGKYRYLYFYPTYYFTPETNNFLQKAYTNIAQTRFDTTIRKHFIDDDLKANFDRASYQNVDSFLIDETLDTEKDRTFKLSYPDDKPLTFYFIALPPGRDPTDTESWVMPAWLAFTFPLILDVKTVVSESPIPPYTDGAEFEETVFLDSPPQALRVLTKRDRVRLDAIVNGWDNHPSPLNALTAAYTIHLDVNPKRSKSGYTPNWGKLSELATDLETSPLYVFSYLKRWTRGKDVESPSLARIRLYTYHLYPCFDPYVTYQSEKLTVNDTKSPMNHPKELTRLFRRFYRANKMYNPKANAILKPIEVASDTILKADNSVFTGETLVAVVAAEVNKLMDRVRASTAEGRWVISQREKERQAVLDFARYFVEEVFEKSFSRDRARLAGRQLNLLKDTCEFLYRLEQDKENSDQ
ncbi:CRISPR-associated protein Csc3 [Halothece sp. PCC 7418]|uniref:type I-D CRISPR-associated protein Cas10d/Csc3 n=1 Tax=Halothece sp. (strain PCC 7418) TaxID=65093 RepID=UPI0002A083E1|nr:type I-D CRISPR-associated protein Cas10d/Csc3 [Halothece sp. PCC 7418]AFZ42916.1 CRISPR-associated protein Csc3 [Halothece sp. PCC 7418]